MIRRAVRRSVVFLPLLAAACSSGPKDVAEKFSTAAYNGDTHGALELLDPDLKQVGGMKLMAALGQAAAKAKSHGGLKSVESTDSKVDGDRGTVTLKEIYGDGTTGTETDKLRKVDGKWFVTI